MVVYNSRSSYQSQGQLSNMACRHALARTDAVAPAKTPMCYPVRLLPRELSNPPANLVHVTSFRWCLREVQKL